jgi:hypothetical protein
LKLNWPRTNNCTPCALGIVAQLRSAERTLLKPFYNWAPIEPFERLGAEFVTAMTRKVNQLSRYPLSERDALRAFEGLKRTPEFFRRYLQRYLAYAEFGSRAALDDTLAHVFNDSDYRATWGRLLPADKAVLRALAQDVSDLHSLPARKRLGDELGLGKAAPLDTPKNALRRLQKDELVVKLEYGRYQPKLCGGTMRSFGTVGIPTPLNFTSSRCRII